MIVVSADAFDPGAELNLFAARAGEGAVCSFTGVVRGGGVTVLDLQHYPGFTERALEAIADDLRDRHGLQAIHLRHRFGPMAPGEPIMFAATAAPHRRAALAALDELMDRLKTEAPFWKRETRGGEARWLEPTPQDRKDVERWTA